MRLAYTCRQKLRASSSTARALPGSTCESLSPSSKDTPSMKLPDCCCGTCRCSPPDSVLRTSRKSFTAWCSSSLKPTMCPLMPRICASPNTSRAPSPRQLKTCRSARAATSSLDLSSRECRLQRPVASSSLRRYWQQRAVSTTQVGNTLDLWQMRSPKVTRQSAGSITPGMRKWQACSSSLSTQAGSKETPSFLPSLSCLARTAPQCCQVALANSAVSPLLPTFSGIQQPAATVVVICGLPACRSKGVSSAQSLTVQPR